ncbi:DUF4825 domain-containing protein [Guptibacillus hwajinpoensis]|uniref:DUF4825 domain-containing protein n=1 Tax=Guptibacillus hwajinpoensis TaxID=208199 RepID=UPI00384C3EAB
MFSKHTNWMSIILVILLVTGCSSGNASQYEQSVKTIGGIDRVELLKFSGTYVGDNSAVLAILAQLPGSETVNEIDLSDQKISVTYDEERVSSEIDFYSTWFDGEDSAQKIYHYNAIYLTILVPNAKEYEFRVQDESFRITRDEMVATLTSEFGEFPSEEQLMEETFAEEYVKKHEEELEKMANHYEDYFN